MRYLPLTPDDRRRMLAEIGAKSVKEVFEQIPEDHFRKTPLDRKSVV